MMAAHGTAYDLSLDFGFRIERDAPFEPQFRLSMSWEHAIALMIALRKLIDRYQSEVTSLAALSQQLEGKAEVQGSLDLPKGKG